MKPRFLLLLSVCASAACAENPQLPPVTDNSTYQAGVAQPARAPSNDAMIELLERMEQMQSEVQGLRGQVEEQAHVIEELKRRQDNIYSDLDARVQQLETGKAAAPAAAQPDSSEAQIVEPQAEESPGNAAAPSPAAEPEPQAEAAPQQAPVEEPDAAQAPAEPLPTDEKQLYQNAYSALKNNQYDQAIGLLQKLAGDYPDGEYADNAYYWLGETYKIKKDTEASREAFNYLLNNFPDSAKVPDAMLKLGFLEFEQHNPDRARQLFNTIIDKYPGSSAATLAQNKLRMMDQR